MTARTDAPLPVAGKAGVARNETNLPPVTVIGPTKTTSLSVVPWRQKQKVLFDRRKTPQKATRTHTRNEFEPMETRPACTNIAFPANYLFHSYFFETLAQTAQFSHGREFRLRLPSVFSTDSKLRLGFSDLAIEVQLTVRAVAHGHRLDLSNLKLPPGRSPQHGHESRRGTVAARVVTSGI